MTIIRALSTIAGCAVFCAAVGSLLGGMFGYYLPDFYRAVLRLHTDKEIDMTQLGTGFGFNAGIFTGLVIGVFVVTIVAYYEMRIKLAEIEKRN